jgi:hypothetical protein
VTHCCPAARAAFEATVERARRGVLRHGSAGNLSGPAVQRLLDKLARLAVPPDPETRSQRAGTKPGGPS